MVNPNLYPNLPPEKLASELAEMWEIEGCTVEIHIDDKCGRPDLFFTYSNGLHLRFTEYRENIRVILYDSPRENWTPQDAAPRCKGRLSWYSYEDLKIHDSTDGWDLIGVDERYHEERRQFAEKWGTWFRQHVQIARAYCGK